ncbi:MAG TPA: hypothetical protein VFV31_13035 [Chitinophagaceae bacterium]|nr:hypothetical protein [Chitinophagaceae bacterium]
MKTIFLLLISATTYGQLWTSLGAGMTNKYLSSELQIGARVGQNTLSVGYIAMPEQSQPSLFNIRAGYLIGMVHIYAGYVHVLKSTDYKHRNYNTWQVGGSYNFCYYKRTTFFVSSSFSPKFITANVGMSYNLFKD